MTNTNLAVILHYNSKLPIKCRIRNDSVDNFFSVVLLDAVKFDINKGDPVVVGLIDECGIKSQGGSIVSVEMQDGLVRTMLIFAENKNTNIERRKSIRVPTSLFGIISKDNMIVSDICIKDISETSVCIYTGVDFDINEQLEIDMILNEDVGKVKCTVVRKMQRYGRKIYGMTIIHDEESLSSIQLFIAAIKQHHLDLMSVLTDDNF